jgi:hypothetical protein
MNKRDGEEDVHYYFSFCFNDFDFWMYYKSCSLIKVTAAVTFRLLAGTMKKGEVDFIVIMEQYLTNGKTCSAWW